MKLTCEKEKLVEALSNVQRAVSQKSTIAALEGILINATDSKLELCGYNTELGITTVIPATVNDNGTLVLSARLLTEIVRKLPGDVLEIFVEENLKTTVTCGRSKFELIGIDAEEFPTLPSVENARALEVSVGILRSMIRQTIFSVSEVDTKPVHTGTLFEIRDKTLTLVSVDGYRLALRKEPIKEDLELSFVVPGKTLREVLRLLPDDDDEQVTISAGMTHIIFSVGDYTVVSRLLDGEFLDYHSTIPKNSEKEVFANTNDFIECIERVSLLITDRLKSPVKCMFGKSHIHLSCCTSIGKADDELQCTSTTSDELEIAFNNRYMADALKNSETDEIKITLNGPLNPIKITNKDETSFIFIVLPVRVKA